MLVALLVLVYQLLVILCGVEASNSNNVHVFYYLWYGNPLIDGSYKHWNHEVLPHWTPSINVQFPSVGSYHKPPHELHSPYYPLHGPYSSMDKAHIMRQFDEISYSGSSTIVASWWGQKSKNYSTDTQGVCTDMVIEHLLATADEYNAKRNRNAIQIAFHLEPYPSRSVESVREDIQYILDRYSNYTSFFRTAASTDTTQRGSLPMFYVYDSYHISHSEWQRLLTPAGDISIRNTAYDAVFIGLWLDRSHGDDLHSAGFDGVYSYFATDGFSYGSTSSNWERMCQFAKHHDMLCILSVGPGYNDTGIRPWNAHNTRDRRDGALYREAWSRAIAASPDVVSVTSYNEWGEGTQIEAARGLGDWAENEEQVGTSAGVDPVKNKSYLHYSDPYQYLNITAEMVALFTVSRPYRIENTDEAQLQVREEL